MIECIFIRKTAIQLRLLLTNFIPAAAFQRGWSQAKLAAGPCIRGRRHACRLKTKSAPAIKSFCEAIEPGDERHPSPRYIRYY